MAGEIAKGKKEWFKSWWGVIIAVLFLPLFVFWWVWKRSKFSPKLKKTSLIIIGAFDALVYGILIFASIASVGTPVLSRIKSPTDQQIITVSGSNVAGGAEVKLLLNGSETQKVKADSAGKFSFANISLNEGRNTLKASTINSKGKLKESPETVVVYQKAQPKEETKTTEPASQTATPTPTQTPKTEQAVDIMDQLWKAADSGLKTREGVEIKYNQYDKVAILTKTEESSWDENSLVRDAYTTFVKYGREAFKLDGVDHVMVNLNTTFTDSYGNNKTDTAVVVEMTKENFQKFNWDNLKYTPVSQQIETASEQYYIYPSIEKKLDTSKLYLVI